MNTDNLHPVARPIYAAVIAAMQSAEELGGPEGEDYDDLMRAISAEALQRIANRHAWAIPEDAEAEYKANCETAERALAPLVTGEWKTSPLDPRGAHIGGAEMWNGEECIGIYRAEDEPPQWWVWQCGAKDSETLINAGAELDVMKARAIVQSLLSGV